MQPDYKTFFYMRGLEHFSLQLKSLKNGTHHYQYQLDRSFFDLMKSQTIRDANYQIDIDLERENKNIDITIEANGHIKTVCDRCTADILLPVTFTAKVYAQISDNPSEADLETYYFEEKETTLDLAPIVYNEVSLHLPLVNIYDCDDEDPLPCDIETLDRLDITEDNDDSDEPENPSPWDALKGIDI